MNTLRWTLTAGFVCLMGIGPAMGQPVSKVLGPLNAAVDLPEFGMQSAGFQTSISISDTTPCGQGLKGARASTTHLHRMKRCHMAAPWKANWGK